MKVLIDALTFCTDPEEVLYTPLHYALKSQNLTVDLLKCFLDQKANLLNVNTLKKSALHYGAFYNRTDILEFLI